MDIPVLNIPIDPDIPIVQGDTIDKLTFQFDALDDIDLTGSTIKMQVYKYNTPFIDISTGYGITIVDDKTFEIDAVAKEDNNYPFGKFNGDLEITLSTGERRTYFRVVYTVLKQYTI